MSKANKFFDEVNELVIKALDDVMLDILEESLSYEQIQTYPINNILNDYDVDSRIFNTIQEVLEEYCYMLYSNKVELTELAQCTYYDIKDDIIEIIKRTI